MQNPPDPRPVFEADQVLTFYDIMGIREGYIFRFSKVPWYNFKQRFIFRVGIGVCNEMLHWLGHGKPRGGVQCKGGHGNGL